MLMVSDLIAVAKGLRASEAVARRSPSRFETKDRMPVVVWNVCQHCNMTCPHCYIVAGKSPSPSDLSHEQGLALIDDLAASGVRVLIFSGGEPLLRGDLFELIEHANALGLACQLSSNGVLIDSEVATRLKRCGVQYVGVSLDGLEVFNDEYRGMEGAFRRALNGIDAAREAGLVTGLRMTITQRNFEQAEAMLEIAREHGVGRFYFSHLVDAGRGLQMASEDLSPAQSRQLLERLFEIADEALEVGGDGATPRIVTGGNDSDGVALWLWLKRRYGEEAAAPVYRLLERRGGNSAGEGVLNIDNRGRVFPDQFWKSAVLGDLRKQTFAEILENPLRDQLKNRQELLTGRCGICSYKLLCRGSHRERALARFGDVWASDPACVLDDSEVVSLGCSRVDEFADSGRMSPQKGRSAKSDRPKTGSKKDGRAPKNAIGTIG